MKLFWLQVATPCQHTLGLHLLFVSTVLWQCLLWHIFHGHIYSFLKLALQYNFKDFTLQMCIRTSHQTGKCILTRQNTELQCLPTVHLLDEAPAFFP